MRPSDNTTPYRACEYDKNVRQTIPYYELFHAETVDLAKMLKPHAKLWLDTGCGTGYLVERAFPHFQDTVFVLADPSEAMLNEAKKRLQMIPANHKKFIYSTGSGDLRGNLQGKLDTKPEIITAIMCHHYYKPEKRWDATATCFEMLVPEGIYITFENIRPCCEEAVELSLKRWRRFQISQRRSMADVEAHIKRFDMEYFPITVSEHLNLLNSCGFRLADIFWYSQMQAGFYAIK
jgi:tRNA (cmo5U34)-methyltransferase